MTTSNAHRLKIVVAVARLLPAYLILALLKHLVPLRQIVRWAWCSPVGPRDRHAERQLAAAVWRIGQMVGLPDRDCLQRSLLLYRVLSRAGADPTLIVGFNRTNGRVIGHAWVTVDNHAVLESDADLLRFLPSLRFGLRGVLLSTQPEACTLSAS